MTVTDVLEQLDTLDGEGRAILVRLTNRLTPISVRTLHEFQANWDGDKSWEEFRVAQNDVIRKCVSTEMSRLGQMAREVLHLPPLTGDSEV